MRGLQICVAALGRICLSFIFLLAAVNKIIDWQGTETAVATRLSDWLTRMEGVTGMQQALEWALSSTALLVLIAVACEMLGGLLILLGIKVRLGAFLLFVFLIPTTLLFHDFWELQGAERELQMTMFLKNVGIAGGLLITLAFGSGSSSASARPKLKSKGE